MEEAQITVPELVDKRFTWHEESQMSMVGISSSSYPNYRYVMEMGRTVLDDSAAQLKGNEHIKELYLGLSQLGEQQRYHAVKHYKS